METWHAPKSWYDPQQWIPEALEYVDPADTDYAGWLGIGLATHHEGLDVSVWDGWSQRDPQRYKPGECEAKWETFDDSNAIQPVTGATIAAIALANGWEPSGSQAQDISFGFDDEVPIVDAAYVDDIEIEPMDLTPEEMLAEYLNVIFDQDDYVCYVVEAYQREPGEKWLPTGGYWGRTAGQILQALNNTHDIAQALGDYNPEAGAWVCVNPVDGNGRKNENITDYRYLLVESDEDEVERQYGIMKALNLPLAAVVSSGNKSIHGIVHIDATDMRQYRERVNKVFDECKRAGLHVDSSTRNPSRLSRLPGFYRGGKLQALLDVNIGAPSYDEWIDWLEEEQDNLPEIVDFADVYDNPPQLSDALIDGILRIGHKMILAGPSKAGKSFYLMELALAIANGTEWAGHKCQQGRVLYINLEIDAPSAIDRLRRIRDAAQTELKNNHNISLWNLRGKAAPIEKLGPRIIRRAKKVGADPQHGGYSAIIIDPIYKIQAGDENAAGDLSRFTNELDRIANETNASVIFCHHQSKGYQGNKSSIDRMSGSGVLARDPDAIIDMTQIDMTDDERARARDKQLEAVFKQYDTPGVHIPPDASPTAMREIICNNISQKQSESLREAYDKVLEGIENVTGWRVTFTLREFANVRTQNVWFDYPLHVTDTGGILDDAPLAGAEGALSTDGSKRKRSDTRQDNADKLEEMFTTLLGFESYDKVHVSKLAKAMNCSEKTIRNYLKNSPGLVIENGYVSRIY